MKTNLIRHSLASLALLCATSISLRAATIIVTNINDYGDPGSLRVALAAATNGDTIDATGISGTISLFSDQLYVSNSVTILGPGPHSLTISGSGVFRVFKVTGSNVTISGLTIASGQNNYGAGIFSGGNILTVSNCTFSGNNGGYGGGMYNSNATVTVNACAFSGNSAFGGGGIANQGSGGVATLTVNASTFSSNTASYFGGGIWNAGGLNNAFSTDYAVLFVTASTFSANSTILPSPGYGGAIHNQDAMAQINACTFSGNCAHSSGIASQSAISLARLEIGDSILNAAGPNPNISGGISDGYNLASDNGSGILTAIGDQTNKNPMLGPLQNNGGPTWTCALLPGSPAIDRGNRDAVAGLGSNTDQRGLPRPVDNPSIPNTPGGDGSDIGAYEVQYLVVTNLTDSGPGSLRQTLAGATNGDTVYANGVSGTITLTNGPLGVSDSVTILGPGPGGLTVSGNNASGVFNVSGSNVAISGLTITDGASMNGGGIYSAGNILTVSNCSISGNVGGVGGGIYNSTGTLTLNGCTVSGNYALAGGGIFNYGVFGDAFLIVNASTISSNSANQGGGIYNSGPPLGYDSPDSLTINASTFNANSASESAGAIYNLGGTVTINASTFSGNSAPDAGIVNPNTDGTCYIEIGDTILDAGTSGTNFLNGGTIASAGYNLSSDNGSGYLTAMGDQTNKNPRLGPLQNNGGPTWTCALLAGSAAIDQGKLNAVTNLVSYTDQRGLPRPVDNPNIGNAAGGDGSDIGAFEEEYSALTLQMQTVPGQPGQMNLVYTPWASGWTYTLQSTTNLPATPFATLTGDGGPTTNGNQATDTDLNATGPQKFYRLLIAKP